MLIKYIKSVHWRVVKRLSYIEEARCLKVDIKTTAARKSGVFFFVFFFFLNCFYIPGWDVTSSALR